jgi:hypothetical protein
LPSVQFSFKKKGYASERRWRHGSFHFGMENCGGFIEPKHFIASMVDLLRLAVSYTCYIRIDVSGKSCTLVMVSNLYCKVKYGDK